MAPEFKLNRLRGAIPVTLAGITAAVLSFVIWSLIFRAVCSTPMRVPYGMCEFLGFFGWPLSLGLVVSVYGYWRARGAVEQSLIVGVACLVYMFAIGSLIHAIRLNIPEAGGTLFQDVSLWTQAVPEILRSWVRHTINAIKDLHVVRLTLHFLLASYISLFAWKGLVWLSLPRRSADACAGRTDRH